jgi:hypothetical protein
MFKYIVGIASVITLGALSLAATNGILFLTVSQAIQGLR